LVDLGQASNFVNATGSFTLSIGSIGLDLANGTSGFGSDWYSRIDSSTGLTSVLWGIAGSPGSTSGLTSGGLTDSVGTLYFSSLSALTPYSLTASKNAASKIATMGGAYTNAGTATANSTVGTFQNTTDSGSWASYQPNGSTATAFGLVNGGIEGQTTDTLGLYRLVPGQSSGQLVGTLSLDSNGSVTFAAVPEPSTYAAFGLGAAILFVAVRRRKVAHA